VIVNRLDLGTAIDATNPFTWAAGDAITGTATVFGSFAY
jgi:hypothetical protein